MLHHLVNFFTAWPSQTCLYRFPNNLRSSVALSRLDFIVTLILSASHCFSSVISLRHCISWIEPCDRSDPTRRLAWASHLCAVSSLYLVYFTVWNANFKHVVALIHYFCGKTLLLHEWGRSPYDRKLGSLALTSAKEKFNKVRLINVLMDKSSPADLITCLRGVISPLLLIWITVSWRFYILFYKILKRRLEFVIWLDYLAA